MKKIAFHIGFHKTGTTWLQNTYFSNQNKFCLLNDSSKPWDDALIKEIVTQESFNFDVNKLKRIISQRYNQNTFNIISAERLSGHPISGGFDVKQIAKRINLACPNAKIIITKREVKSFIVSVYKQMIREGYCGYIEDFLFNKNWKTVNTSKDYFFQEKIINNYRKLFGPENVLVLNFDEFTCDKDAYLRKIEKFLNLENNNLESGNLQKVVNKAFSDRRMKAIRLLNRIRKTEHNPFPIINIGTKQVFFWSKILSFFISKKLIIDIEIINKYIK